MTNEDFIKDCVTYLPVNALENVKEDSDKILELIREDVYDQAD